MKAYLIIITLVFSGVSFADVTSGPAERGGGVSALGHTPNVCTTGCEGNESLPATLSQVDQSPKAAKSAVAATGAQEAKKKRGNVEE